MAADSGGEAVMSRILDFLNSTGGMFLLGLLLYVVMDWREITRGQP